MKREFEDDHREEKCERCLGSGRIYVDGSTSDWSLEDCEDCDGSGHVQVKKMTRDEHEADHERD